MTDHKFSPDESLHLIRSMIEKTKQGISDNSIYFLIWGWAAFLACLGQYVLKVFVKTPYHYHVWWITFVCAAITLVIGGRQNKAQRVRSFIDDSMSSLWMGLGIGFFVLSTLFIKVGWQYCYPFFILLYGLGTFISGKLIRFTPLVVGGIINFVLAAISVHFSYDTQMLFTAGALLSSYIIPGHMLSMRYKHANRNL